MAVDSNVHTETFLAGADLSAKRYYLAKQNAAGEAVLSAAGTDRSIGPIYEPNDDATDVAVAVSGQPKVLAGGTIGEGDRLTSDANGKAVATTTPGDYVFGEAMEEAAAGEIFQFRKVDYYVPA